MQLLLFSKNAEKAASFMNDTACTGIQSTFMHENSIRFLVKFLGGIDVTERSFRQLIFSDDSLSNVTFNNLNFENCFFGPTSINDSFF
jgi:hypothetical protein